MRLFVAWLIDSAIAQPMARPMKKLKKPKPPTPPSR